MELRITSIQRHLWTLYSNLRTISFFVIFVVCLLNFKSTFAQQCRDVKGCYPPFVDLLPDLDSAEQFVSRSLNASSTCGDPPSQYDTTNFLQRTTETCNASDPLLAHPVRYVQDSFIETVEILGQNYSDVRPNLNTWWQSENGDTNVTLTLSLQDQFLFQSMLVSFKSKKPQSMIVEARNAGNVSSSRDFWYPLQYFAKDCSRSFPGVPMTGDDQDLSVPFCEVLDDSTADVQEQELVLYNPSQEYFDAFYSDESLYRHYMLTDVRLLMLLPGETADFFAVSDWEVKGQCSCFGHAAECTGENENVCECAHHTRGVNCEECLPLYNNRPWRMGTPDQANVCQDCGCHGHASSCYYDAEKRYGVCENCTDNTEGDKCDQCRSFHYLSMERTQERNTLGGVCRACDCTASGITNNGTCDNTTGQCTCKEQVFGRTCDTCKVGFWNLTADNPYGCQACDCDAAGTFNSSNLCDQLNGTCVCKDNTDGDRCDRCKVGSYNLTADNPTGCTLCECDPGGSVSPQCNSTGYCQCRPNMTGKTCSVAEEGFFVPFLDDLLFEAEVVAEAQNSFIVELDSTRVTGSGYLRVPVQTDIYFNITVLATHSYAVVLRYNSEFSGDYVCVSLSQHRQQGCRDNSTRTSLPAFGEGGSVIATYAQLSAGVEYIISIYTGNSNGTEGLLLDSLVLLPDLNGTTVYQTASPGDQQTLTDCWTAAASVNLQTSADCQLWGNAVTAEVYGVQECSCTSPGANGTACSPLGGQCTCLPGVVGRGCDMCAAYTYGIMSGEGCTACDCNQSGSVVQSCDPVTGVCRCHENVLPPKCDSCAEDHYGLQTGQGCLPCTCNMTYSYSNSCSDEGQCPCKPWVGGMACTECMEDYYGLTDEGCTPCGCNRYGSLEGCHGNGTCHCRNATQGDKCDTCKPGYYGLGNWTSDGCLSCFCSNHSSNCSNSTGWYQSSITNSWSLLDGSGINESRWQAVDGEGGTVPVREDYRILERIVLRVEDVNSSDLYLSAPDEYLGDKRSAYLQSFMFTLSQTSLQNQTDTPRADVIIRGWYRTEPLVTSLPYNPGLDRTTYEFKFHEDEQWFVGNISHGRRASKEDIVTVLSNITQILIRAKYTTTPGEAVDLYYVRMDYGTTDNSTGPSLNTIEDCYCPDGYQGQFCEECAPGYTREVPGLIGDPLTPCVPCDCNGHEAGPCHADTGVCSCTHNTTGDHCELCVDGFYGDAMLGNADSCQPCECPGLVGFDTNYFAETCDENGTCHNCIGNHVGNHCQDCAEGFYGQPHNATNLNGACLPCNCTDSPPVCDSVSGQCTNCTNNTGGDHCERCADGWYGLVMPGMGNDCTECNCNNTGSMGPTCDYSTGQCACQPNITGRQCDVCVPNSWNFSTEGCTPCSCHQPGAVSPQCDLTTGACPCTDHAVGMQCDGCETGYYHNQDQECVTCNCSSLGTVNGNVTCDPRSGQCDCRSGVRGQKCDQCDFGFEGDFPNCTVCPPCFNASVLRILNITEELNTTFEEIQALWAQYGNMSVEEVRQILTQLNGTLQNVTAVLQEEIVDGRNIRELNMLYAQIRDISGELESHLARLNSTQADLDKQLEDLSEFDGTVVIDGQVISPESTGSLLDSVKVGIANRTATANITWQNINQIQQDLNASLAGLYGLENNISHINRTLQESESLVQETLVITRENYTTEVQQNVEELGRLNETAAVLVEQFTVLATNVSKLLQDVQEGNLTVQQSLIQAEELVRNAAKLERLINQTQLNSSAVQMEALATLSDAQEYQMFAGASLSNMTSALAQVTVLGQLLEEVNNKTSEAGDLANSTLNMSIRQLQDMVNISSQINSTTVAEELVNRTLQGAQEGLQTAQALRNVTQAAEEEAGRALALVQQIETSLIDSNKTRQNVRTSLQTVEADRREIHNITAQVMMTTQSSHGQASTVLSDVFLVRDEVGRLQQCFLQGRQGVLQLANTAQGIHNVSESNTQTMTATKQELTAAQTQADALVSDSEALQQEALELQGNEAAALVDEMASLEQVAEIQDLLDVYIAGQQEMEDLEAEMTALEGQLDSLIASFEAADPTTQQCRSP
ncbi:laminin subunit alpha-3-like isoform X2 [Branchiostoma floridae x Branchiostoma japonicum]